MALLPPSVDYTSKDFDSLRTRLMALLQSVFPDWTLILGESELGVEWELGPSDRFARYAFDVTVDVVLTETERRQIRAIVNFLKPGHTHFIDLIEPTAPVTFDHWELGISELGDSTELH